MTSKKPLINSTWLVRIYLLLAVGGGLFALFQLLIIPTDRKNVTLWGYSPTRLVMLVFVIVGILGFLSLLINTYRKPQWVQKKVNRLEENFQTPSMPGFYLYSLLLFVTLVTTLSAILIIFIAKQTTDEFIRGYLIRLSPIVIWLIVLAIPPLIFLVCFGYRQKIVFRNFQLAFSKFQIWLRNTNLYRILGISILFSAISFSLLYSFLPTYRDWFIEEDQFLENLTTGLFLGAFFLSALILVLNRGGRLTDFSVPAASLLGFLEEVSYGERFSKSIPMLVPDQNIDALHDYFKIGFLFIQKQENNIIVFLIGGILLVLIFLAGYFLVQYLRKHKTRKPLILFGPLIFTLISATIILIALVLDLNVLKIRNFTFIEELLEFFTGLTLCLGAISIYQRIVFDKFQST